MATRPKKNKDKCVKLFGQSKSAPVLDTDEIMGRYKECSFISRLKDKIRFYNKMISRCAVFHLPVIVKSLSFIVLAAVAMYAIFKIIT